MGNPAAHMAAHPNPDDFFADARRSYAYWRENRAAFDTAAELLADLPDGRWIERDGLADALEIDTSSLTACQFHPAYTYEDFFEGFRPRKTSTGDGGSEDGAGIAFELVAGPLRRLADAARRRPAEVFVLVIDEINRANLAKVFGELYFLLEYRKEFVHLLYGSDEGRRFRLPPNLLILGTMNTTDRTIALMDAAMRRRFAFLELHPDSEPTASVLRTWLGARHLPDDGARLLDALNQRIAEHPSGDRDFRIGPSYFLREAVHTDPAALERLWRTQILPLLAEYHWGDGTDIHQRYGLEPLRAELGLPADGSIR